MFRYGIFRHLSVPKTQTRAYWGSGMAYGIKLKVWGEYACFTRPEMKVERIS
jgi:hypothetical protein